VSADAAGSMPSNMVPQFSVEPPPATHWTKPMSPLVHVQSSLHAMSSLAQVDSKHA
jgi:hypothetical protein